MRTPFWIVLLACLSVLRPAWADIDCDGVDDLVNTGVAASNFYAATTGTIMGVLKASGAGTVSGSGCWASESILNNFVGSLALGQKVSTTTFCLYNEGSALDLFSPSTYTLNQWYHIAARYTGGTTTLWVDGVQVASGSAGSNPDLTGTLTMCGLEGNNWSNAVITELRTYTSAIDPQILANLGKSRRRLAAGPVPTAYWPLDECADGAACNGVSFKDRSGNGRHGTGDDGGNNSGLVGKGSASVSRIWGPN